MAISTYKTFLMHDAEKNESYEKLLDIKSFPDMGGEPEMIETTTLSDNMTTNIPGIQSLDALEFEANYDKTTYQKLKALEEKDEKYSVWLGGTGVPPSVVPTGSEGKFNFTGKMTVWLTGGGVNEVVGMTVSIAASTPIAYEAGA